MVSLDNLVVTTALPVIRRELHASISQLEWTVNAYTLTFAVLLLTGAALGDRFGRRRMFVLGMLLFTGASAAAALSTSANALDIARALQGVGGAIVTPLTLTILSAAVPTERRGLALGIWGGIGGLAVALGPLVGGAIVSGVSWNWIFWLNVPIGLVLAPLAYRQLDETKGAESSLDLPGLGARERRAARHRLGSRARQRGRLDEPRHRRADRRRRAARRRVRRVGARARRRRCCRWSSSATARSRSRTSRRSSCSSGCSARSSSSRSSSRPCRATRRSSPGLRILPWTAMPIFIAPIAGALSDRIGGQRLMAVGLTLQAAGLLWIAAISTPTTPYIDLVGPFVLSGIGMALFFAPVANVVLSSVRPEHEGKASGANNAIRELGGVFGVAVLAAVFSHVGGYQTPESFTHGMTIAVYIGGALVAVGAVAASLIKGRPRERGAGACARGAPSALRRARPRSRGSGARACRQRDGRRPCERARRPSRRRRGSASTRSVRREPSVESVRLTRVVSATTWSGGSAVMIANSSPPMRATKSSASACCAERLADAPERGVAGRVAVHVVQLLQAVDVGEDERERLARRAAARELLVEGARVAEAGEEVAGGVVAQAVDELAVPARVEADERADERVGDEADPGRRGERRRRRHPRRQLDREQVERRPRRRPRARRAPRP